MNRVKNGDNVGLALSRVEDHEGAGPALVWLGDVPAFDQSKRAEARLSLLQERPNPHLAYPLALERGADAVRMVMQSPAGDTLARLMQSGPFSLDHFLTFAPRLAEAVEALHNQRMAHGHLSPDAIFVQVEQRKLKLAIHPDSLTRPAESPADSRERAVGDLRYAAPEQSGRTQQRPDLRADLFSLGVIFHEMLTGRSLFASIDRLELMHLQQAVAAPPLPDAPPMLAQIVARLLEKAPGDRYQTAYGLLADLRECRARFERDGRIEAFDLSARDQAATFRRPDKLYGRRHQVESCRKIAARMARGGVELVLIAGPAGSGKSVIADKLRDVVPPGSAPIFVSGKYEETQGLPYQGLMAALRDFVLQKLSRGGTELADFRSGLQEALGDNLSVLADFLPEIVHIIGDIPTHGTGEAVDINQRFRVALQAFFEVISDASAPLILFLDDLQWADGPSIDLLETVLTSASPSHLALVGAYRDDELTAGHRAQRFVDTMRQTDISVSQIKAEPLSGGNIRELIHDTLHLAPEADTDALVQVMHAKTQGNAFHVVRLLNTLYREGVVFFDAQAGQWQWDMRAVRRRVVDADVARLMTDRLTRLSDQSFDLLRAAAAFGSSFTIGALKIVSDDPAEVLEERLSEPVDEGFLTQEIKGDTQVYRFSHDMVRDTAYGATPEAELRARHYRIGSYLLADISDPASDERLFSAMDQMMLAADLIRDPGTGRRVTQGAIAGAQRLRAVAAHDVAAGYLALVQDLPTEVSGLSWDYEPEMTAALEREALQVRFITDGPEAAAPHFDALIAHLPDDREKAMIYQTMVTLHTARSDYERAMGYGIDGLKLLGVDVSGAPGPKMMTQLAAVQLDLRRHDVFDLSKLPPMDDPEAEQLMGMMMVVATPAFLLDKNRYVLISLRMFRLTLKKGLTDAGLLAAHNYAIVIYLAFKATERAYKIETGTLKLLDSRNVDPFLRGRHIYPFAIVLAWHFRSYAELREMLHQSIVHSWNAADLEYVGYHYYSILKFGWMLCDPLEEIAAQLKEYERYEKRLHHEVLSSATTAYRQAVAQLTDPDTPPGWTTADRDIEAQMTGEASIGTHLTAQLLLTHVFGNWDMLDEISTKLRAQDGFATLGPEFVDYHLLLGLSLTRAPGRLTGLAPRKRRKFLKTHLKELARLAEKFPVNHRFQSPLLEAEAARLNGDAAGALPLYDKAIGLAEEAGIWSYCGIVCECAAEAATDEKRAAYLRRAHEAYSNWGATNKLRQLEALDPALAQSSAAPLAASDGDDALDTTSMLKASQLLLEVTDIDTLLKRVMKISMENAGADRGMLYLMRDGALLLAAEGAMKGAGTDVVIPPEPQPLDTLERAQYPREIVAQVAASTDPVILSNAQTAPRYAGLTYVQSNGTRSVICLPVTGTRGLQAVLYLENSLADGVFTAERQEVLTTLSALAATSLSNAMLYARQGEALALEKRAGEELARVNRLQDEFLANTSHELRTPLNGIIGLAASLAAGAKGQLPGEAQDTLKLIVSSGERLQGLVDDILDLSRMREGEVTLTLMPVDLRALVDVVFTLMGTRAAQVKVRLVNDVPEGFPGVLADEARLQQILLNLVDNGIKFSDGGAVSVSATEAQGRAQITVADQGVGIAADMQTRIFESFRQADGSAERAYQGVGLGLTITRSLVELHGGQISVESRLGAGSRFTFDMGTCALPLVAAPARPETTTAPLFQQMAFAEAASEFIAAPVSAAPQQHRALVVDDDPINLEVLKNYMQMEGYGVDLARDGAEALRLLEDGLQPDIVLLDVMMPGVSGYDVCREIRKSQSAVALPIIMLTAKNRVEDLRAGFEAGATDFLTKPFSREELSARMRSHIAMARVSSAYRRFVPVEFLDMLGKESILDIELGDNAAQRMTVMFTDIRGYTGMAETLGPAESFRFLNDYFGRLGPVIGDHRGVVNSFLGDGLMALFPGAGDQAVAAAVSMQRELRRFNAERAARGAAELATGIGLHTGDLILGIIGDAARQSGNVVSDAVNLASRLEGLTSLYGVGIVASEEVIDALSSPEAFAHRKLGVVQVIGRELPATVYEIYATDPPAVAAKKTESRGAFEAALEALRLGQFEQARAGFARIAEDNPEDSAARYYVIRSADLAARGAEAGWTGVEVMDRK